MHRFLCPRGHTLLVECDLPVVVCLEHLTFARVQPAWERGSNAAHLDWSAGSDATTVIDPPGGSRAA